MVKLASKVVGGVIYIYKDGGDTSSNVKKIIIDVDKFIEDHAQILVDMGDAQTFNEAMALVLKDALTRLYE